MHSVDDETRPATADSIHPSIVGEEFKSSIRRLKSWKRVLNWSERLLFLSLVLFIASKIGWLYLLVLVPLISIYTEATVRLFMAKRWRKEAPTILDNAHDPSSLGSLLEIYPLLFVSQASLRDAIRRHLESQETTESINLSLSQRRSLYKLLNPLTAGRSPSFVLCILTYIMANPDAEALPYVRSYQKRTPSGELGIAVNQCLEVLTMSDTNRLLRPSQSPKGSSLVRPVSKSPLSSPENLVRASDKVEEAQHTQQCRE